MNAVDASNIGKDFLVGDNPIRVLNNINLHIKLGELTMLVGPSGCGKTTLISILSGILSATVGQVLVMNHNITAMTDRNRVLFRRKHIGFIFQQFNLLPSLNAAENVAMPLIAANMPVEKATEYAKTMLAKIGMADHIDKLPRQLSGGQQQRIAIARALIHDPQLIVCDEPTASLDAKTGKEVMDLLREIANNATRAVLIVTHDSRIFKYADRIIEMSDGKIVAEHNPGDYIHKE
jgi:putative ABC transport system ATP-binding protein